GAADQENSLSASVPNPFVEETSIYFFLSDERSVRLFVLNAEGREVLTLRSGVLPKGSHAASWDGRDSSGRRVPPGVYLYRLEAGSWSAERRMTLADSPHGSP
ncbi:MAG: FlgD immunoglobulin-like domain containing protein, partial [Candidatus Eisenbacteria bacterium]